MKLNFKPMQWPYHHRLLLIYHACLKKIFSVFNVLILASFTTLIYSSKSSNSQKFRCYITLPIFLSWIPFCHPSAVSFKSILLTWLCLSLSSLTGPHFWKSSGSWFELSIACHFVSFSFLFPISFFGHRAKLTTSPAQLHLISEYFHCQNLLLFSLILFKLQPLLFLLFQLLDFIYLHRYFHCIEVIINSLMTVTSGIK